MKKVYIEGTGRRVGYRKKGMVQEGAYREGTRVQRGNRSTERVRWYREGTGVQRGHRSTEGEQEYRAVTGVKRGYRSTERVQEYREGIGVQSRYRSTKIRYRITERVQKGGLCESIR